MKKIFQEYPYAAISCILGTISLIIVALVYVGAFDFLLPIKEQGHGVFNMLNFKKVDDKNLIDYLNMGSILLAVLALIISFASRLKKEEKIASNTALLASISPLIVHYYLIAVAIILIVGILHYLQDF